MTALADRLDAKVRELGFLAWGVADLAPSRRAEALDDWLARGYGGTMRYLHRQARKRKQPAEILPGARTAVMVLDNYLPPPADRPGVKLAKYALGRDYHAELTGRLEGLAALLRGEGAGVTRVFADAGPVPERELAERAGLGWIGKNGMLIRRDAGSFFFIGAVFSDLALPTAPAVETDHCGSCTRCLEACPTDAFVAPRVLDATRCISYLTIEAKGPIPEELAGRLEGWAFGCDVCNDVCPWNEKFARPTANPAYHDRLAIDREDPEFFTRMTEPEFARRFGDTPLERPGLAGMRRNFAAAFGDHP
ncbi:MAG: tRNA epoxyqueuosine(34) reductase QueG [Gemmatimonadales bacterium]